MVSSDDTARARLASAPDISKLEEASTRAEKLIAELDRKTRKPHACHVCGTVTKEDEA
jgi:recombinational DNA repair protein RecR